MHGGTRGHNQTLPKLAIIEAIPEGDPARTSNTYPQDPKDPKTDENHDHEWNPGDRSGIGIGPAGSIDAARSLAAL